VRNIDEPQFADAVLEASKERPVVVDFWSQHCPPCHVLGPVLESLESASGGAWELVKIDVDDNPQLADDYRVMSIPAVKAFVGGEVVDAFVGAWPRDRIQAWLADIVPSPSDNLLRAARTAERGGDFESARAAYDGVLAADSSRHEARLGLARLALRAGDYALAHDHLASIPVADWPDLRGGAEAIWLETTVAAFGAPIDDTEASFQAAMRFAASGDVDEGLRRLLALVTEHRDWQDGRAGAAMVRVIAMLGDRDPRAGTWRSRLGRALYR